MKFPRISRISSIIFDYEFDVLNESYCHVIAELIHEILEIRGDIIRCQRIIQVILEIRGDLKALCL